MARVKNERKQPKKVRHPFARKTFLEQRHLRGYKIVKRIGKGAYGIVYKAVSKNGKQVALKLVNLKSTTAEDFKFEQEMSEKLSRKGVGPRFHGGWSLRKIHLGALVSDLWDGNLAGYMERSGRKSIPKIAVDKIRQQISLLQRMKIAHLDLHSDNVLVREAKGKIVDATLTDFGLATPFHEIDTEAVKEVISHFKLPKSTSPDRIDALLFQKLMREWK